MLRRTIYVVIVLLVVGAIVGYNYMYQDHRDIHKENAVFVGEAKELNLLYKTSQQKELLNKTVIITGVVTAIEDGGIALNDAVFASYSETVNLPEVGDQATIKGRCIGYDDLFELVMLDQSTLID